jgi:hypothetical protein
MNAGSLPPSRQMSTRINLGGIFSTQTIIQLQVRKERNFNDGELVSNEVFSLLLGQMMFQDVKDTFSLLKVELHSLLVHGRGIPLLLLGDNSLEDRLNVIMIHREPLLGKGTLARVSGDEILARLVGENRVDVPNDGAALKENKISMLDSRKLSKLC